MPVGVRQSRLPGIGVKYDVGLGAGSRLTIILHNDGMRELYWFRHRGDEQPGAVITLDDDEARKIGAIVGGAYARPKIIEDLEMALGELQIEWVRVPEDSPWIGRTLAEAGFRAKLGVTVIAILREPEPVSGARPEDVVQRGDTLVAVGKAGPFGPFRRMLAGSGS